MLRIYAWWAHLGWIFHTSQIADGKQWSWTADHISVTIWHLPFRKIILSILACPSAAASTRNYAWQTLLFTTFKLLLLFAGALIRFNVQPLISFGHRNVCGMCCVAFIFTWGTHMLALYTGVAAEMRYLLYLHFSGCFSKQSVAGIFVIIFFSCVHVILSTKTLFYPRR